MEFSYLLSGFIGAIIASVLAAGIALYTSKNSLRDSLDTKSGWREDLFNTAAKTIITVDDVYLLKAALRLSKHSTVNMTRYSFKFMTNVIFNLCDDLLANYDLDSVHHSSSGKIPDPPVLSKNDSESVRICARYLLKYHWDFLSSGRFLKYTLKDSSLEKFNRAAEETCRQLKELGRDISYE